MASKYKKRNAWTPGLTGGRVFKSLSCKRLNKSRRAHTISFNFHNYFWKMVNRNLFIWCYDIN